MGCDIHLYIEHKDPEWSGWFSFGGQYILDRDYRMFTRMAGVRGIKTDAVAEPRGLPADTSYQVKDDNRLYISDERIEDDIRQTTREQAERWVRQGSSQYDGTDYVTDPDWHSHSWLTAAEFEQCINSFREVSNEYKAVLAVLKCFESHGEQTRVVFWFDN